MTWKVSADPVDFEEAIAWFLKRVSMTREDVDKLDARAKQKAFWVSHVAQLDLVHHAWKALDKAIAKGTSLEDFKKEIGPALTAAWGSKVKDPAWRLEIIFRNGVQRAYSAGRYRQATTPEVLEDRPVWMFDAILDGRETEICAACDGTKLPADHAWWETHQPPLHHGCRSSFVALTEREGGKLSKPPKVVAQEGFGVAPAVDEDGNEWTPDLTKYPDKLRAAFEDKTS